MLQFLGVFSIFAKSNFKPFNFVQFLVYVSNDVLHAYYTKDQTTFLTKNKAMLMDWYVVNKSEVRMMRGPADSKI
jgi:hypothetical protein